VGVNTKHNVVVATVLSAAHYAEQHTALLIWPRPVFCATQVAIPATTKSTLTA